MKFASPHHSKEWIGDAHTELKEYDKALAAYTESLKLKPDYSQAARKIGNALSNLKRYAEAVAAYQNAIKLAPNDALNHSTLGDAYSNLKQHDKAVLSYGEAARLDPKNDYAVNMLAVSHYRLKQYAAAHAANEQAVKLKPDNALYLMNLGDTYFQLGRKPEALAVHKKLVTMDKAAADELLARINTSPALEAANAAANKALLNGHDLVKAKEYSKAIVEYQKAVAAKPSNVWLATAYFSIGDTQIALRDYPAATMNLLTAARLDPNYAAVYDDLGIVYERTLQLPKALAACLEAIRLSDKVEDLPQRKRSLGRIYALMGRRAEAIQVYNDLQKTNPEKAKFLLTDIEEGDKVGPAGILAADAMAWSISGEPEVSLELYRNALKLKPTNNQVLFDIGNGLVAAGETAEGMAVYRHVLTLKPNTEDQASAHYFIGQTHNYLREYAKAIAELRTAQKLKADHYQSLELGQAFRGLNSFPKPSPHIRKP